MAKIHLNIFANTFLQSDIEHQVTYYDLCQNPVGEITHRGFAQLDLVLCAREALAQIKQIRSDRWQTLASHHFLTEFVVELMVDDTTGGVQSCKQATRRRDLTALQREECATGKE